MSHCFPHGPKSDANVHLVFSHKHRETCLLTSWSGKIAMWGKFLGDLPMWEEPVLA